MPYTQEYEQGKKYIGLGIKTLSVSQSVRLC